MSPVSRPTGGRKARPPRGGMVRELISTGAMAALKGRTAMVVGLAMAPKRWGTHQHEDADGSQWEKRHGHPDVLANRSANAQGGVNSSRMVAQAGAILKCT